VRDTDWLVVERLIITDKIDPLDARVVAIDEGIVAWLERECPKCGQTMEYQDDDPDTGIVGGWSCDCGHSELDPDRYADDFDLDRP
jgi:hypothetical protein